MSHELQNEENRTRHILKMKQLDRLLKDKIAFERYLNKMAKMAAFRRRIR